tara:strand:+ start:1377 stop:2159 length:783 start_codon:yes stop_codon:yes gene_type:complete
MKKLFALLTICLFFACSGGGSAEKSKKATLVIKELPYIPCDEAYIDIPGANFSANCVDGFSKVPNFELINHNGDTITNQSLEGENYILHFFFASCPTVCPNNTKNIYNYIYAKDHQGNEQFSEKPKILSISIDNDSPEVLRNYMTQDQFRIDINSNWYFLTGDPNYVRQFASNMSQLVVNNFTSEDKEHFGYAHSEYVLLVDKEGFFRKNINGEIWSAQTEKEMDILRGDIKALIKIQNIEKYKTIKISKENSDTIIDIK